MATTTIDADLQGVVFNTVNANLIQWSSDVRDATNGSSATTYTTATNVYQPIEAAFISGRGNYQARLNRTFLFFDVSSVTSTDTITAATLKVRGGGFGGSADTVVIQATAWGEDGTTTSLTTSDYSNIDYDESYSTSVRTVWYSSAYNDFTMSTLACNNMNTDGYLNLAVIEYDHDYLDSSPSLGNTYRNGIKFLDSSDKIKIVLTHSPSGYGHDIMGVDSGDIVSVNGVASADIVSFNGVS
tara:strand:+ start:1450 stop:2175 length:726 start_codon:yes stop_codon:yes gene_type:complete